MPEIHTELLPLIKQIMQSLYGERFRQLVLYGSFARCEARDDSDIDLLCLLEGPVDSIKEISPIIDAISDIQNEYADRVISVKAVDEAHFERGAYPLVIEAKREGIKV